MTVGRRKQAAILMSGGFPLTSSAATSPGRLRQVGESAHALRTALLFDGSGVTVLTALTLRAVLTESVQPDKARGLVATTIVGIAGLAFATAAVRLISVARTPPDRVHTARRLVTTGLAINTVGCGIVLLTAPGSREPLVAASLLLAGGNVLSGTYHRHLRRISCRL